MTANTDYLRDVQYRVPDRLEARQRLHRKYGRSDWFDWLASALPWMPGATCLDIGCGAGAFWSARPAAVPRDVRPLLFDQSPGMVEAAFAAARGAGWGEAEGQVADAAALPVKDSDAEIALLVHVLYHLADPERGVAELARVLRPGGVAAVVLNPAVNMVELTELVDRALDRRPGQEAWPGLLSAEGAVPLLRRHFARVQVLRYEDPIVCTNPADLRDYLLSLPVADPPAAAARLSAEVDAVFARTPDGFAITKAAVMMRCER